MKKVFVGISLKTLFEVTGGELKYGTIEQELDGEFEYYYFVIEQELDGEFEYYDFVIEQELDGENCQIVNIDENSVTLVVEDEKEINSFKLTHEEYGVSSFGGERKIEEYKQEMYQSKQLSDEQWSTIFKNVRDITAEYGANSYDEEWVSVVYLDDVNKWALVHGEESFEDFYMSEDDALDRLTELENTVYFKLRQQELKEEQGEVKCNRCHSLVAKRVVESYAYDCIECYEYLYTFEAYKGEKQK